MSFKLPPRYQLIEWLSHGARGEVYSVVDKHTRRKLAVKRVGLGSQQQCRSALRELRLLHFLAQHSHSNIVQLLDAFVLARSLCFVLPLLATDLRALLSRNAPPLTFAHITLIQYQILRALKFLHSAQIMHRDLTPANVLVDARCDVVLCDLGSARMLLRDALRVTASSETTTLFYRAPEGLLHDKYTFAVDLWAAACIFAEMWLCGAPLFCAADDDALLTMQRAAQATLRETMRQSERSEAHADRLDAVCDYMRRSLQFEPSKRLTAADALQMQLFEEWHDEKDEPTCEIQFNDDDDDDDDNNNSDDSNDKQEEEENLHDSQQLRVLVNDECCAFARSTNSASQSDS